MSLRLGWLSPAAIVRPSSSLCGLRRARELRVGRLSPRRGCRAVLDVSGARVAASASGTRPCRIRTGRSLGAPSSCRRCNRSGVRALSVADSQEAGNATGARPPVVLDVTDGLARIAVGRGGRVCEQLQPPRRRRGPAREQLGTKVLTRGLAAAARANLALETDAGRHPHPPHNGLGRVPAVKPRARCRATLLRMAEGPRGSTPNPLGRRG